MQIRQYRTDDEEGWLRCCVLSFLHTAYYDNVLQQKKTYDHPSIELVAVDNGKIVGLIDIECEQEIKTICVQCSSLGGMIWHLAVHPDFQQQGIGRQLLLEAEKRLKARNINQLEAYTRDDEWVNSWYQKNDFHQVNHYLHVFMENDELNGAIESSLEKVRPISCFAHYTGEKEEMIKKKFGRVHECRCYRKDI
ncbi:GNAT family N-acetyltransferase [Sporolactobacillus shoreicorticis]|uniref:GNAT family N-acetyltransferase n=1 Tax=Sporolactobacillus shoreicorticis TaxID=1923877 RepID=A0ABW5RXN8_9BACL|nr:GNAT family N-acetyltransferase [Sporolactobacillus shoreicorticis]MCO7124760.1 GNAT family N-acetyltransferase [Sporolactobacillus shoreicorticis]